MMDIIVPNIQAGASKAPVVMPDLIDPVSSLASLSNHDGFRIKHGMTLSVIHFIFKHSDMR
jgi:dihydroorotase